MTLFVFSQRLRSTLSWVYIIWGVSLAVWNTGTFFMFRVSDPQDALFWARFLQFGVIFLPISLAHLCWLIAQIPVRRFMPWLYGLHVLFALSNFTSLFVSDVRWAGYAYYAKAGPVFWIFVCTYNVPIMAMVSLYHKRKNLPSLHQTRLTFMIIAVAALIVFGTNDTLPILGFNRYPFIHKDIFPCGSAAAIFYGILVGYSVLQHQLLDIHVTLGRLAAQSVRLLFVLLLGFSLLFIASQLPGLDFKYPTFIGSLAVFFITIVLAAYFFPRFFGKGEERLERRILGDRFEYHDKINGFIQSVPWYSDTTLLLDDLHDLLVLTMRMRSYQIILLDETARAFSLLRSFPEQSPGPVQDLQRDAPVFQFFYITKADYLTLNPAFSNPGSPALVKAAQQQLKRFEPEFCFPFFSEEDPIGLLLIGQKTSGEPYTPHDLHLLTSLVKNLNLIINQIRLKQKVLISEEMELLGRMSRGMAHDLNNLITPVWTFLQLTNESPLKDESTTELLPAVTRNVEAIRQYVKESLFYSNTMTPHFMPGRLDLTILKAVELVQPQLKKKGITIDCQDLPPVEVEMDAVLIQRLLCNLYVNACDASPVGATIQTRIQSLAKTEVGRNWFRVQIIDPGEGISREHLRLIFRPYFTTKDRGGEQRGFGLGLAICRKIVHLHGGNLNIASEENKGTTVLVDLPSRQHHKPAGKPGRAVVPSS
ncbi:MAG: hypothetical protein HY298_10230 [Verrucomicrobia bacterium]|nr:hypothetical protein [Verrucomicrobiota bacterium]